MCNLTATTDHKEIIMRMVLITALASFIVSAGTGLAADIKTGNPFASPSPLPFQAPPFDKIKNSDYLPAFKEGMRQQLLEVDKIANNPAQPNFDNTIAALEKSGAMLERVSEVFFALVQANTDPTLDAIQKNMAPKLSEHHDKIYLNSKLFDRIKKIYAERNQKHLDQEALQLLKVYYMQFVHAGANLNAADKLKLQILNKKIAELETSFQQKLLAANNKGELSVKNRQDLEGLSENEINALVVTKGKNQEYVIPLQNTTQQPLLQSISNRQTRQKLFEHSWNRAERNDANDTRDIIATLALLRSRKAAILGYPNYADYVLYDQMAEKPETVHQFLGQLIPATANKTTEDARQIQAIIDKEKHFNLRPWDWNYYAEKIRKIKFDLDQNEIQPYFELNHVLQDGVYYAASQLYGVTFKERHDIPVYHPDVRVFDVFDKDHSPLGLLYLDYFKRDNKTGGAWMNNFVQQSTLLGTKPVVYNVTNFLKPAKGEPALLTSDDVTTMFHEFGHALHGLFSNNKYPLTNTNMARDFVELPSQFNEHWAFYPDVLKHYAVNYKTGQPMPQLLADKIEKARTFNQGYSLGEILAASSLDMQWHELPVTAGKQNVDTFELQALKNTHTDFPNVPPRYRSSYFLHIWANGYSAGYYAYLWTEMLDDDVYEWFIDHGGMTRANGQRFRDMILSRGHSEDYGPMFKAFYGKNPTIEPMLRHRGLS